MNDLPDRLLVARAVAEGLTDLPVDTNPAFREFGARLVRAEAGRVVMRFDLDERWLQGNGVLHGGIVGTLLDSAMAYAVMSTLRPGEVTATVSLTVNFLAAASVSDTEVEAEVEKRGRSLAFLRARLTSATGSVCATATATFAIVPTPSAATAGSATASSSDRSRR
jgi:uncharacterized protein (TIGR00369 family)